MTDCYIRVLTSDGLQPVDYSATSLVDAAQYEPSDGIYTVTNTYNTFQTLKFDAHLDRMEDSARRSDIPLVLDRDWLKTNLHQMIADAGFGDVRFRITVGKDHPDRFIITLEPFTPPAQSLIEQGTRVITAANSARVNAAAKTTGWMHQRKQLLADKPDDIYDIILMDAEEHLLEGLGANFYAIMDDELRTAGEGVLPGIAQQIVFEIAPLIIPVRRDAVMRADIPHLQEAFITSSSRGIIPVVEIDGHQLGDGTPGETTKKLRDAYLKWMDENLQEL